MKTENHPYANAKRAAVPIMAIETADPAATMVACQKARNGRTEAWLSWDCVRGLRGLSKEGQDVAAMIGEPSETQNLVQCLDLIESKYQPAPDDPRATFFLHAGHKAVEDWTAVQALWNLRDKLKAFNSTLVLLGPAFKLPPEISSDAPLFEEPVPTEEQIASRIKSIAEDAKKSFEAFPLPDADTTLKIQDTLRGYLSIFAIEQSLALGVTKEGFDLRKLWQLKVASLKSTAGLEISQPKSTFTDLAGCYGIKGFLGKVLKGRQRIRGLFFLDEIEKMLAGSGGGDLSGVSQKQVEQFLYWTEEKKVLALLLLGVPGAGKSWTAACTAGEAGVPLLRGSISAAQSSLVGSSTENMRNMLRTVDSVTAGSTLMIATCNSLDNLTPEVLSRFKLGVFFYDYPSPEEADALWKLYKSKYELNDKTPGKTALWTGREVESCCHRAWLLNCTLDEASKSVVPVSRANGEKMNALRRSARGRFLSAGSEGVFTFDDLAPTADTGRKFE